MKQRRFGRLLLSLAMILMMTTLLMAVGCDDNDNDATPDDFAGLTLTLPAEFIDAAAAGDATIAFSADGSTATITFADGTEVDVDVTEGSIVLTVTAIRAADGSSVTSVDLDGDGVDDIAVGDTVELDATIDTRTIDGVEVTVIVLIDADGNQVTFEIEEGETGATGTTGG